MNTKINIETRNHVILIRLGAEFAIFYHNADISGMRKVTFSFTLTEDHLGIIKSSKIVSIQNICDDWTSVQFKTLPFYETHLIAELITDILKKHETSNS